MLEPFTDQLDQMLMDKIISDYQYRAYSPAYQWAKFIRS